MLDNQTSKASNAAIAVEQGSVEPSVPRSQTSNRSGEKVSFGVIWPSANEPQRGRGEVIQIGLMDAGASRIFTEANAEFASGNGLTQIRKFSISKY